MTKAGDSYARYMMIGQPGQPESVLLHLSKDEREFFIDSMISVRSALKAEGKPFYMAEQLLRRVTGSITEYIEAVGERPQYIDSYDYAALSIRDSNIKAFREAVQQVQPEKFGGLLILATGQPGRVGNEMTETLLAGAKDIPCDEYVNACKRAVDSCNQERAVLLLEKAESHVKDLDMKMYGDVIMYAMSGSEMRGGTGHIAYALARNCTPEQIRHANPFLLEQSFWKRNSDFSHELIRKGIVHDPAETFFITARLQNTQTFYMLRRQFGDEALCGALAKSMRHDNLDAATFLLRNGAEFTDFKDSLDVDSLSKKYKSFLDSVEHYWEGNIKPTEEPEASQQGSMGMSLQ